VTATQRRWRAEVAAWADSEGKYLNSAEVPFYVVPGPSEGFDPKDFQIFAGAITAALGLSFTKAS
jgi:hypothetical protein